MYAIIDDSGQQFRVQEGDEIEVDLRAAEPGSTITFDRVMLVSDGQETKIGKPLVEGATVTGEVLAETKGPKLEIYKFKPRKRSSRRHVGHRQKYLSVRIAEIKA
ncbi:MAG: 50S ribosomal protein L21 [Planctomycetes bacterium]|nr:50S ribosomal protein L21 [Planctomycetota bacterium]